MEDFDLGLMKACKVADADGTAHPEIEDGQQRMDTICLIYAAAYKILTMMDHEEVSETIER